MRIALLLFSVTAAHAASCSSTSLGNGLTCYVSITATSSGASTGATTSNVDSTGGNLGIALVLNYQAGGTVSLTDARTGCSSPCNTWTALSSYSVSAGNVATIYYAQAMTVGAGHNFHCGGTTTYCSLSVAVIGTLATSSVFDTGTDKGTTQATAVTSLQIPSLTPPSGVQLIVAGIGLGIYGGTAPTIDSGMTVYEFSTGVSGQHWSPGLALATQASGVAIAPTWSFQSTSSIAVAGAAFKVSAATSTVQRRH